MAETMKAVVKTKPQLGAEMLEIPIPKIKDDEVLVKVRATSICGTDVHIHFTTGYHGLRTCYDGCFPGDRSPSFCAYSRPCESCEVFV